MPDNSTATGNSPFAISPTAKRFLAVEARTRKKLLFLIFVGGALNAFLEVTGLALVFPLLAVMAQPQAIEMVPWLNELLAALGLTTQREVVAALIIAIAVTMASKNAYMVSFYWWQSRVVAQWKTALTQRLMRIYVFADLRLHLEKGPSVLMRNLSYAGLMFDQYILPAVNLVVNLTVAVAIAGLLSMALPTQTLVGVGTLAIGAALLFFGTRSRFASIGRENQELDRQRSVVLQQGIGAIQESKVLGREHYFLEKFTAVEHRLFDRQGHFNFLALLPGLGLETAIVLSMLAIVGHVIFISGTGAEGLATIGLLAAAMFRLLPMTLRIMNSLQLLNFGKPVLELIADEIVTYEHRVRVPVASDSARRRDWQQLELNNVGFTYPDGTRALHGVNLTIKRGEFVGITGRSGSGKSTLMLIALGLLEPTDGTISVDGAPLSDPSVVRQWQNGIGYVPQGLYLVDGTLAENVAFGSASPDLVRVTRALEVAQLGEYVASQPEGIHAPVGDYGSRLSGGQKQRVIIARALYCDPDLIAFDEATSTLDVRSESALTDYVRQFRSRKSMLAIAHRLSTIQHCDRIIYLEDGTLKGCGTFADLKADHVGFQRLAELSNL